MDIEEIYTWVDRGRVGDACTPPGSAGKALVSEMAPLRILCRAQTARRIWLKLEYVKPEPSLIDHRGVHNPGGSCKWQNSTFGLTRRGSRGNFGKLTLEPASSPGGLPSHQIWRMGDDARGR